MLQFNLVPTLAKPLYVSGRRQTRPDINYDCFSLFGRHQESITVTKEVKASIERANMQKAVLEVKLILVADLNVPAEAAVIKRAV